MGDLSGGRIVWPPCYQSSIRTSLRNFSKNFHQCLCYELKCVPPKETLKSLPSVPVTMTLFGNGVHIIRLGWGRAELGPSSNITCVLIGRKKTQTLWENVMCSWRQRAEWCIFKPRNAKDCRQISEVKRKTWTYFHLDSAVRAWPCQHPVFRLWPLELWREYIFLVWSHPSLWYFVLAAWETNIIWLWSRGGLGRKIMEEWRESVFATTCNYSHLHIFR